MDEWLAPTFNRHAQKIWKKNKCKRMVRKIGKRTDKSYDGGAVAISLFNRDNNEEEEEKEEKEKDREERRERLQKNQEWRQRRQCKDSDVNKKENIIVDKDARNRKIQQMFICINCGESAEDGRGVWTCGQGHLICHHCIDLDLVEQRIMEDRKLGSESGIEDDMCCSFEPVTGQEDMLSSKTLSDISSYVRPHVQKIDFFENTLDIRRDAITPYEDYNALLETKERFSTLSEASTDVVSEERFNHNKYLQEECPPPYTSDIVEDEQLKPASLEVTLQAGDDTEDDSTSWKQEFERNRKEIDFFENTLDIRKNAIESYSDYKLEALESHNVDEYSSNSDEEDTEEDTDSDCTDEDDESFGLVSECPQWQCRDPTLRRNEKIERIIELFNNMMEYRNKL